MPYQLHVGFTAGWIDAGEHGHFQVANNRLLVDDFETARALVEQFDSVIWPGGGELPADESELDPESDAIIESDVVEEAETPTDADDEEESAPETLPVVGPVDPDDPDAEVTPPVPEAEGEGAPGSDADAEAEGEGEQEAEAEAEAEGDGDGNGEGEQEPEQEAEGDVEGEGEGDVAADAEALADEPWQTATDEVREGNADEFLEDLAELDDRTSVQEAIADRRAELDPDQGREQGG